MIVKKYKDNDKKALKGVVCKIVYCFGLVRSGTEEEYTTLHELLEDIVTYQRDSDLKAEDKAAPV